MPNKTPTIVITGASGFLGTSLVHYLENRGWNVKALVRNAQKYQSSAKVEYIEYDLRSPIKNETTIFKSADYLVHTAYVKYNRDNPDALEVNVKAAKNLLKASNKYGLRNLFVSTMSAHNDATSVYGKQKLAIEKLFNSNKDIVIRSGLIIGNGGIVKEMSDFMKTKHIVPLVDGGNQPLQIVAISDLVGVIVRALTKASPGTYTIATPEVYSYREFYNDLAKSLGVQVLFVRVPFWALVTMLRLVSLMHLPFGISEDNALGLKNLKSVNTAPDLQKVGIRLKTLPEALNEL